MNKFSLYLFFFITFSISSAFANIQPRIIGGENVTTVYPWMVSLQNEFGHFCGGVLIHKDFVLTAAHCIEGVEASDIELFIGSLSRTSSAEVKNAEWLLGHTDYDEELIYKDIAIIKLSSSSINQPISLPSNDAFLQQNQSLTVMGWGLTINGDRESISDSLKQVDVSYQSDSICAKTYPTSKKDYWDYSLCAGELSGGKDSCSGDSGGPLVVQVNGQFQLIGLVSWGNECGLPEYYGVYTQISALISWIKERINGISIIGQGKIGFLGYERTKSEVLTIINATDEALEIDDSILEFNELLNFNLGNNQELFDQGIPAKSECKIVVNALGNYIGEHDGKLIIPSTGTRVEHDLNSKVLTRLTSLEPYFPWPMFSGTKTLINTPNTDHKEPWIGVNIGDDEIALKSGSINADERSLLLTYLNGPESDEDMYLRFDAKVDAQLPDGLYTFVNEAIVFPESLSGSTANYLHEAGALNSWHTYQLPLTKSKNHILFIFLNDKEGTKGTNSALIKDFKICFDNELDESACSTASSYFSEQESSNAVIDTCKLVEWEPLVIKEIVKTEENVHKKKSGGSVDFIMLMLTFLFLKKPLFITSIRLNRIR